MASVLILDGHTIQSIPVFLSLKRLGVDIISVCTEKSYGYYSLLPKQKLLVEEYTLDLISDLAGSENVLAILPLFNDGVNFLNNHRDKLCDFKILLPSDYCLSIALDKIKAAHFLEEYQLPQPRFWNTCSAHLNFDEISDTLPVVIKPANSSGANGLKIFHDKEQLYKFLNPKDLGFQEDPELIQEYIDGNHSYYTVMLYRYKNGDFSPIVACKVKRFFPVSGGSSCLCEVDEVPEVCDISTDLLAKLDWVGFANLDIIRRNTDKSLAILDINPRIPGSIKICFKAGINFVDIIMSDALKKERPAFRNVKKTTMRYYGLDFIWLFHERSGLKGFFDWVLSGGWFCPQDFFIADPLPFFGGTYSRIKKLLNPKFRSSKGLNRVR